MTYNIANIFNPKKILLQAYQKEKNELQKKNEKRWKEQKGWEKKIKDRAIEKINVDTTVLPQLNQKIVLAENLENSKKLLKQTYKNQHHGDILRDIELQKQYKPIIKPLQELVVANRKKIKQPLKPIEPSPKPPLELLDDIELPEETKYWWSKNQRSEMGPTANKYLDLCYNDKNFKKYERDETFGITDKLIQKEDGSSEGHLYIGNCHISINGDNVSIDGGKKWYKGTEGLWELLTRRAPENYSTEDLDNYREIVERSSTHRRDNDPMKGLKASSGYKYLGVIKNLFQKNESPAFMLNGTSLAEELAQATTGKGLRKIAHNYPVEYKYYHSPKQLRYRYKVFFGEIQTSNNDPVKINELVNIGKELDRTGRGFFNNVFDKLPIELHVLVFEYFGPGIMS